MAKRPLFTTQRAAKVFKEMISYRRDFCADHEFPSMTTVWSDLCDDAGNWQIKKYKNNLAADYDRKVGVICFDNRLRLTVDEAFWERAKRGDNFLNFELAHELSHVALNHHARQAVVKNFKLFDIEGYGMSNAPPNLEELEANYAATFFQCGVALLDPRWEPLRLASRACSNVEYVKKAQSIVRTDVFRLELARKSEVQVLGREIF